MPPAPGDDHDEHDDLVHRALAAARDTRQLELGPGLLAQVPAVFRRQFGPRPAAIVADTATFAAAGRGVRAAFEAAGHPILPPFVFDDPALYAQHRSVDQ